MPLAEVRAKAANFCSEESADAHSQWCDGRLLRFLRKLEGVVDWEVFTAKLVRPYPGTAKRGRPPYNPVVILKILVLSYLYDLSERQVEACVNDSLSAKWFLGMAVDEAAPCHSTLTKFKGRLERQGKREACGPTDRYQALSA